MWPFDTRLRAQLDDVKAALTAVKADRERIRKERNQFLEDRDTQKAVARKATEQYADLYDQYSATRIVNERLTDDLTAAQKRIAEYGVRRTVSDVLVEHDVHRKALADALGPQKYHLNWDQLIAEAARLNGAAEAWMKDFEAEKKRADAAVVERDAHAKQAYASGNAQLRLSGELATAKDVIASHAAALTHPTTVPGDAKAFAKDLLHALAASGISLRTELARHEGTES